MNLPKTMKAVRLYEHGAPSVLKYEDVEMPEIGPGEVLIRVQAASINSWDLRYRSGNLPKSPIPGRPGWRMPFQLGRDGAGDVVAVGRDVTRWKVGDRVVQMVAPACGNCAMCRRQQDNLCVNTAYPGHQIFGSYAQYMARAEGAILAVPEGVSYELAASTLWAYTTPFNCAVRRAPTGLGKVVVITGASGGLAIASLQLAKLGGATVIGTTTKPQRRENLLAIGYDHILDSNDPDMPKQVKALTGGLGADAVWETVGGSQFLALSIACLRVGGAIAVIAQPLDEADGVLNIVSTAFIYYELNLMGVRGGTRHDQEQIMDLLGKGKIRPIVDRTFPLREAAAAHEYLEAQKAVGKIVLLPQEA